MLVLADKRRFDVSAPINLTSTLHKGGLDMQHSATQGSVHVKHGAPHGNDELLIQHWLIRQ